MKKTSIQEQVADLQGLYVELRKAYFDVMNVGSDRHGTYIFLSDSEGKDPSEIARSWVGKVPDMGVTQEAFAARKAVMDSLPTPGDPPVKMLEVDGDHVLQLSDVPEPAPAVQSGSVFSKFFRKIW